MPSFADSQTLTVFCILNGFNMGLDLHLGDKGMLIHPDPDPDEALPPH